MKNNIAYITDSNQYKFVITNIVSMLQQTKCNNIIINVVLVNLNDIEKDDFNNRLEKYISSKDVKIVHFDDRNIQEMKSKVKHITYATYVRIFLPEILADINNVLYLDNDTVVIGDIAEAFDFFESNVAYGRPWNPNSLWIKKLRKKSFLGEGDIYVNAGVMHFPLERMRKENFSKLAIEFYEKNSSQIKFGDQDIINIILDDIKPMPWVFNIARNSWPKSLDEKSKSTDLKIYHFLSIDKQWSNKKNLFAKGRLTKDERKILKTPKEFWNKIDISIW